jgi:hypothetical protein
MIACFQLRRRSYSSRIPMLALLRRSSRSMGSAESSSEKETCPTEKGKEAITQTCFSKAFSAREANGLTNRCTERRTVVYATFHKFNPSIRCQALSVAQTHPALIIWCELASHWRTEVLS